MNDTLSYAWVDSVNPENITLYPIQFANCERLRSNPAVFIFDEVGSGKTISSGLMALDYLYNQKDKSKKVLVITTNALVKHGQFLDDWKAKLPFEALNLLNSVEVINNHCSNLARKRKVGLLIIDEAHLFLSTDTQRYENLIQNIRADKVIFLTATPIKAQKDDLYTYVNIAEEVTQDSYSYIDASWIDKINTENTENTEDNDNIICSLFDPKFPVTRYFKDTIMSLNENGFQKTKARRLLPEMWFYDANKSKQKALLEHIEGAINQNKESHFVIFTRYVEKEARGISKFLCEHGFSEFNNTQTDRTVKVVTGDNAYELKYFKGHTGLPTVLILTYQIAEQGVNLPGFNYVINYHISAYPSALEQRFGRIDRMGKGEFGSKFPEIHMSFLIAKNQSRWDTNTQNFYTAVATYMGDLLSYLPSKNTILSPEIIKEFRAARGLAQNYVERMRNLLNDAKQIKNIYLYLKLKNENDNNVKEAEEAKKRCNHELLDFIDEQDITVDVDSDNPEKALIHNIRDEINNFSTFKSIDDNDIDTCMKIIEKISDNIFYGNVQSEEAIKSIHAVEDCGKCISECSNFIAYNEQFNKNIKCFLVNKVIKQISPWLNRKFEQYFIDNDFTHLFPLLGYEDIFRELFAMPEFHEKFPNIAKDKDIIELLIDRRDAIVKGLPFFKMCDSFKKRIQDWQSYDLGYDRLWTVPFVQAFIRLEAEIKKQNLMGLSDEFVQKYWPNLKENRSWEEKMEQYRSLFRWNRTTNAMWCASNWYKLAYHYTEREAICWDGDFTDYDSDKKNIFSAIKQNMVDISKEFKAYPERYESEEYIKSKVHRLQDLYSMYRVIFDKYKSYFHDYIFTSTGNYRKYWDKYMLDANVWWFYCWNTKEDILDKFSKTPACYSNDDSHTSHTYYLFDDLWSMGIFIDLKRQEKTEDHHSRMESWNSDNIWGDFLPLPKPFSRYLLYPHLSHDRNRKITFCRDW